MGVPFGTSSLTTQISTGAAASHAVVSAFLT